MHFFQRILRNNYMVNWSRGCVWFGQFTGEWALAPNQELRPQLKTRKTSHTILRPTLNIFFIVHISSASLHSIGFSPNGRVISVSIFVNCENKIWEKLIGRLVRSISGYMYWLRVFILKNRSCGESKCKNKWNYCIREAFLNGALISFPFEPCKIYGIHFDTSVPRLMFSHQSLIGDNIGLHYKIL